MSACAFLSPGSSTIVWAIAAMTGIVVKTKSGEGGVEDSGKRFSHPNGAPKYGDCPNYKRNSKKRRGQRNKLRQARFSG